MSKQDIEKRLGFAAQGVKETTRTSAKAKMALTIYTVGAKNACYEALANLKALAKLASDTKSGWDFHVTAIIDHVKSAMSQLESSPAQAGTHLERAINTLGMLRKIDPVRLNDIQKGSLKQLIGYVAKSLRDARANIKVVTTAARPGAKAKMATPAESEQQKLMLKKGIASINKSISAGEANLRDDIKRANWSNAVGGCQALSSLYLRLKEMYAEWNKLARSTEYARPGAKAKFGIWGDAPDKYRAAIDFIQNQRTPSSAAIGDLKKAIKNRQSEAVKTRDPKAKRMYENDAGGLQNVLEHAQRGDHSTLLRSAYNLDTAVRDDIPIEMFIWAGADVNWSHRNAKSLLDTVSALVNRTKHGKSVGIKAARPGVKAKA